MALAIYLASHVFSPRRRRLFNEIRVLFRIIRNAVSIFVNLSLGNLFDWNFVFAYLLGSLWCIYWQGWLRFIVVFNNWGAIEAQCSIIGNVGFLGIPMLALLMSEAAVGYVMMVLAIDLLVFGSIVVMVIVGTRDGRMSLGIIRVLIMGLLKNPMILSIVAGLLWAAFALPIPQPINEFMTILGSAATPGALFAIGASLASKSAERIEVAGWLSLCKLILHPAAIAFCALYLFEVEPYAAAVMIAASALPVAGNVIFRRNITVSRHNVYPRPFWCRRRLASLWCRL